MRVPIPVVIFLVLAVVGGIWWKNTRHMDFLTPPSAARLEEIRVEIESSLPRTEQAGDAISVPVMVKEAPPPVEEAKPAIDLGDLTTPPTLRNYAELAPKGSAYLIELAAGLEEKGEFQRALLAWERVIDSTQADDRQAAAAISSIKRLRPTLPDWNAQPEAAIPVMLHAGTSKKFAATLAPILEGVARDLGMASSGTVKVTTKVTVGKTGSRVKGPTLVALWLAGPDPKSASTEVLSFTVDSPDSLRQDILKNVFLLVRSHLGRAATYTPPAGLAGGENPLSALDFRVSRLCWSEFASALKLPPKKAE